MADNRISAPILGTLGTTPATSPVSIARRIAIEAALSLALFHVRRDNPHAAVGRAIRAASMLKQACAEATATTTTTTAGRV